MTDGEMTRREFRGTTARGAAAAAALRVVPARAFGANERISVGIIGAGGRGGYLMNQVHGLESKVNVRVGGICDTWRPRREEMAAKVKEWNGEDCPAFADYEELLARKDIDAVIIAPPDFAHARVLADAVAAGKDAYVEKPFATEMEDANVAYDAVKKSGRVVQVGTQRRSEGAWGAASKLIQRGVLGKITRIEIAWNDSGPRWMRPCDDVKEEDVAWRRFLMDKKYRRFDPKQYRLWQFYRDFTNGPIALLGVHFFDVVSWFMDDPYPTSAVANGGHYIWNDGREHEDTVTAVLEYPKGFMCEYTTMLGNASMLGTRIYGMNGTFSDESWTITGAGGAKASAVKEEIKIKPETGREGHMENWINCMRSRKRCNAPVEAGHQHAVANILAYKALVTRRKLKYLPDRRKIVTA